MTPAIAAALSLAASAGNVFRGGAGFLYRAPNPGRTVRYGKRRAPRSGDKLARMASEGRIGIGHPR
jgi:hypothetical protein